MSFWVGTCSRELGCCQGRQQSLQCGAGGNGRKRSYAGRFQKRGLLHRKPCSFIRSTRWTLPLLQTPEPRSTLLNTLFVTPRDLLQEGAPQKVLSLHRPAPQDTSNTEGGLLLAKQKCFSDKTQVSFHFPVLSSSPRTRSGLGELLSSSNPFCFGRWAHKPAPRSQHCLQVPSCTTSSSRGGGWTPAATEGLSAQF